VGIAERALAAVFKKSEVAGAHAHRFRHTLATEILARGGTEQDVADILGVSAAVVRKHYAKWSQARQQRITSLFEAVYPGTYLVHGKNSPVTH
jgi:integrase